MDCESMSSITPLNAGNDREPERDLSREADLIMDELDIVLRCQCCAPANGRFRVETWESDFIPASD
jgi:hypothetical protein